MTPSPFKRMSFLPLPVQWLLVPLARLLYRVRTRHAERIPETGGVLILTNHLSYLDPILLQLACPRPVRFLAYEGFMKNPLFAFLFRVCGVIPISTAKPNPKLVK